MCHVCSLFSKNSTEEDGGVPDHGSLQHILGLNLPFDHQDFAEGQESLKAKVNAIRNKLVQQVRGKINNPTNWLFKVIHLSFHKRE